MAALARGRRGRWAPVINTALFAIYHFFSPVAVSRDLPRVPADNVDGLAQGQRRRILAAHMTINIGTVLLLAAGLAAGD